MINLWKEVKFLPLYNLIKNWDFPSKNLMEVLQTDQYILCDFVA